MTDADKRKDIRRIPHACCGPNCDWDEEMCIQLCAVEKELASLRKVYWQKKERDEMTMTELKTVVEALDELVGAIEDAKRRHIAGDSMAIESNMIRATLHQAKDTLAKISEIAEGKK